MSSPKKSAELEALNDLLYHLKRRANAEKEISTLNALIRDTPSKPYGNVYGHQLSTDNYDTEASKYIQRNKEKKSKRLLIFGICALCVFVAMVAFWLFASGIFVQSTYLHTPEIVKEYNGTYYNSLGDEFQATLAITSCSESGGLNGYFEFSWKSPHTSSRDIYGKYTIQGKVTTKSREGYITAKIEHKEWVEKPSGYSPLKSMEIKIYDNYQVIRCFDYNMCLYAEDYEQPTTVTELETPEILKEYTGKFTPNTGKVGTASITINSCNAAGEVTGEFFYSFESSGHSGSGKWELTGQITQKYDNGSVKLTLVPSKEISSNYMFYYPSKMEVEIYDNYRSFESMEGMYWFYEDEGFAEDPNPVKTPLQELADQSKLIVFAIYPGLVLLIALILYSGKTNSFTAEEQRKLDELIKLDAQNRKENEQRNKQGLAQAQQKRQQQMADYRKQLRAAQERYEASNQKVSQASILAANDKTLRNVEFLIDKMESGRADSLKEALLLLDENSRREQESWLRAENARLEAQRRAKLEADLAMHNLNVEWEQRRQANELEKIRKALED